MKWIEKIEVISRPNAALTVKSYTLTPEAKRLLDVSKKAWDNCMAEQQQHALVAQLLEPL